jgi:hypothetical protein
MKREELRAVVANYVSELTGPQADDAWHSLLELGAAALPHVEEAFRLARATEARHRLAEVVCHVRSMDALPFLIEVLHNRNPELWKIALDGLVMLGDEPTFRARILE